MMILKKEIVFFPIEDYKIPSFSDSNNDEDSNYEEKNYRLYKGKLNKSTKQIYIWFFRWWLSD
jgi:hypothetical protein